MQKIYGQLNNIMSVMGKQSNEISALHLVKTYCLPTLLYGCEAWLLSDTNLHKINTIWHNCFRQIFSCCWRESTRPLQFFCKSLPLYLMLDQRKLVLWLNIAHCDNIVLRTISILNNNKFVAVSSKYDIDLSNLSECAIKQNIWSAFADTVIFSM